MLAGLRTGIPDAAGLRRMCRGHKAWLGDEPSEQDMKELFRKYPQTTIVTCTKRAAEKVNDLAVRALHPRATPLAMLPGDVDANPDNFDENGEWRQDRRPVPAKVPVWKNTRLFLTQNVRKDNHYVNGMECSVQNFHDGVLYVMTKTKRRLAIVPWTNRDRDNAVFYPIRLGYASNVHRIQGAELEHVTAWLDIPGMRAAGYTALSRVATSDDYLIGGCITREHFVPAT